MKKFFYSHPDVMLSIIALVLLGILFGFFSWGINDVVVEIHDAMVRTPGKTTSGFDLKSASQLNFRGLISTSSPLIVESSLPSTVTSSTPSVSTSTPILVSTSTTSTVQ